MSKKNYYKLPLGKDVRLTWPDIRPEIRLQSFKFYDWDEANLLGKTGADWKNGHEFGTKYPKASIPNNCNYDRVLARSQLEPLLLNLCHPELFRFSSYGLLRYTRTGNILKDRRYFQVAYYAKIVPRQFSLSRNRVLPLRCHFDHRSNHRSFRHLLILILLLQGHLTIYLTTMSLIFPTPPLTTSSAHLLTLLFTSSYVGLLYLSKKTRLSFSNTVSQKGPRKKQSDERWRDDPDVIKARLVLVTLVSVACCGIVFVVIWNAVGLFEEVRQFSKSPRASWTDLFMFRRARISISQSKAPYHVWASQQISLFNLSVLIL